MYQQAAGGAQGGGQPGPEPGAEPPGEAAKDGKAVDADYEIIDDDKK
jgi:hypothetical protein